MKNIELGIKRLERKKKKIEVEKEQQKVNAMKIENARNLFELKKQIVLLPDDIKKNIKNSDSMQNMLPYAKIDIKV